MKKKPEVWLRGPIDNVPGLLQPVAHALLQAGEEVDELMTGFPEALLWERPAGLASPGFHLQHLTGVLNRLFTYADGRQLDQRQLGELAAEGTPAGGEYDMSALVQMFSNQVTVCITQLGAVPEPALTAVRTVGRAELPSTAIGLYVHAAEHTMRHIGQLLVTVKILADKYADEVDSRLIT